MMTVIADSYQGKPLNSPNGVAPHPDGSIWFTDPAYGDQIAEGHPDEAGGPANPLGILNPRIGAPDAGVIGGRKRELPTNTYSIAGTRAAGLMSLLPKKSSQTPTASVFRPITRHST
jgi:hypothetical protein